MAPCLPERSLAGALAGYGWIDALVSVGFVKVFAKVVSQFSGSQIKRFLIRPGLAGV